MAYTSAHCMSLSRCNYIRPTSNHQWCICLTTF